MHYIPTMLMVPDRVVHRVFPALLTVSIVCLGQSSSGTFSLEVASAVGRYPVQSLTISRLQIWFEVAPVAGNTGFVAVPLLHPAHQVRDKQRPWLRIWVLHSLKGPDCSCSFLRQTAGGWHAFSATLKKASLLSHFLLSSKTAAETTCA